MLQSMGVAKSRTRPSVSTELKPGFKEFRKPCCTLGKAFSLQMEPKRGALQIQPTEPPRPRTALPLCPRGHSWTEAPPAQPRHSLEGRAGRGLPLSAPWTPASLAAGPCVCVRLRACGRGRVSLWGRRTQNCCKSKQVVVCKTHSPEHPPASPPPSPPTRSRAGPASSSH